MDCVEDSLEPSCYMQFSKNAVHMGLNGLLAYEKLTANFLVRATGCKERQNFALSWRQIGPVCLILIIPWVPRHIFKEACHHLPLDPQLSLLYRLNGLEE